MNKIKVVISAIWYPLAMATYFWRAFERRKDVDLIVAGPFTGAWIPWLYGIHLPQKYVKAPDVPLPKETISQHIPSFVVECQLPWTPDLWVQIDAGWHFANRPNAKVVAHVQTDPHVLKFAYDLPKAYSDLNFCMQKIYMQPGEIYLPYAFDPTVHYPMPEVEKIYDACLIGLQYPTRNGLVNRLQSHGLKVKYETGLVFDEYRLAYNQSKVALSWSTLDDIPCRVFEALGMGLPLVANVVPDMKEFFENGIDYFGFHTLDEADNMVRQLLADDDLRMMMANHGWVRAQQHTWDNRIEQILKESKLI
jgi:glycosyltransferase involved in cell wall biosynthesis